MLFRSLSPNCRAAFISSPRRSGCSESGCPTAPPLFLDLDDQLSILQLLGQSDNGGLLLAVLLDQWADNHLGTALLGREGVDHSLFPLPFPGSQVRGVEPLAPQQKTQGAGILSRISLVEDGAPILGGEAPPTRAGDHFGIRNRRLGAWRRGARCFGNFFATLRSCQRSGRRTGLAYASQGEISFPALQ